MDDIDVIVNDLLKGNEVQFKGDGYKFNRDAKMLLTEFVKSMSKNQIKETAAEIKRLDAE